MAGTKTALVFGASGISGWSMVNEILSDYPAKGIWDKIHALTNRPLTSEASFWPSDARLDIVSGVNLLDNTQEQVEQLVKYKVKGVENVTHVFYLARDKCKKQKTLNPLRVRRRTADQRETITPLFVAYKAHADVPVELQQNVIMFQRTITAMDRLSPALEFVVLQTGSKTYGCHLLDDHPTDYIHVPLREDMPRLRQPHHDQLFYYAQLDWLAGFARGKTCGWADTRPDVIVGFVPNQNFYSVALSMGHGEGARIPFPGSTGAWHAKANDSSAEMIARQTLHVVLKEPWSRRQGEAWNVADSRDPSCWAEKWPVMCEYFGLEGYKDDARDDPVEVRTFIKENMDLWTEMEAKYGLQTGHADNDRVFEGFEYVLLNRFTFDRHYDMSKMYDVAGFREERTTRQAYGGAWNRMRMAKIIPASFS